LVEISPVFPQLRSTTDASNKARAGHVGFSRSAVMETALSRS
jgi:hypothetical protein